MRVKNNKKTMATKLPIIFGAQKDIVKELRDAGCVLALMADRPLPVQLEPRSLYNGIQNGIYTQKVSEDYTIKSSDVTSLDTSMPEFVRAVIPQSKFPGMLTGADSYGTRITMSGKFVPKNNLPNVNYCYYFTTATNMAICFPPDTTLEQARAELAGTIVRYQLATTIDRLNIPLLKNPQPERTLPNLVKNELGITNVSDDYVLTAADVASISLAVGVTTRCNMAMLPNMFNFGGTESQGKHIVTSISEPLAGRSPAPYTHNQYGSNNWAIYLPNTIQTVAEARAFLTGVVVRFQLATPITEPFTNPLIDQVGKVTKNLLDPAMIAQINQSDVKGYINGTIETTSYACNCSSDHIFTKYLKSLLVPGKTYRMRRTKTILSGSTGAAGRITLASPTLVLLDFMDISKTFTVPLDFKTAYAASNLILYGTSDGVVSTVNTRFSDIQLEEVSIMPNEFDGYLYTENTGATFERVSDSEFKLGIVSSLGRLTVPLTRGITFKPNTQYMVSGKHFELTDANPRLVIVHTDGTTAEPPMPTNTETEFSFISDPNKSVLLVSYAYGSNGTVTYKNLKIQEITGNPAFEVYGKNNATLLNVAATKDDGFAFLPFKHPNGDPIPYANLIPNAASMAGWSGNNAVVSASGGVLNVTANGVAAYGDTLCVPGIAVTNKRMLKKVRVRVRNSVALSISVFLGDGSAGTTYGATTKNAPVMDTWYEFDFSTIASMTTGNLYWYIRTTYADAVTANGKVTQVEKPLLVCPDDIPQLLALETKLGRQLTIEECDELLAFTATNTIVNVATDLLFVPDGLNTVGLLASLENTNVLGKNDFDIGFICKTDRIASNAGYIFSRRAADYNNQQLAVNFQPSNQDNYELRFYNSGALEGLYIPLAYNIPTLKMCAVFISRRGDSIELYINKIPRSPITYTFNGVSQPNTRMFASTTNILGTTHASFWKLPTAGFFFFHKGAAGLNKEKSLKIFNKIAKRYGI